MSEARSRPFRSSTSAPGTSVQDVTPGASSRGTLRDRLRELKDSVPLLRRVIAGSALLAFLVAGTFVVLLFAMSQLGSSTNEQARSKEVTTATLGLERVVNQLEVSLRAFVVSGDPRFLVSWQQARGELSPAMVAVEKLVADQPEQSAEVQQLNRQIRDYVSEYGLPLIGITRQNPKAARASVVTNEGLTRVNAIHGSLAGLLASEDRLASGRVSAAKHDAGRAVRIGLVALVAMGALLFLFGIFLTRAIARPVRTVVEGASRVASGDLSTRLPVTGAAELQELTKSFNAMARSLDHGKRELEAQNEELRQSERLKSELVSIVSHELRTPLASILGYASLLLRRDFEEKEVKHYAGIIHSQGTRLSALIEDFLDVERVEAGRIELKDEPLDLKPLLLEEAQLIADETPKHRIAVEVGENALPVRGDRDRLAQVYGNLLSNAVKYSPDGGLVEVVGEVDGSAVRVHVRDDGIGIPDEHQRRIFTKFFRGEARESGIAGTGLGLAVAREIVEAHGGRIGFRSQAGGGSAFWFELPLARN
jgi:signal transduction histidine kinase